MKPVLVLVFLTFRIILSGQLAITGTVIDADNGERLMGVQIYLLSDWRKSSVTDSLGQFSLDLEETSSSDSMVVSYFGYQEQKVAISNDMMVALEVLQLSGETVVITATPIIAAEFKYIELDKIDIYTNPAAKADPLLAINSLPAATTVDESANISLRGSNSNETGILLNNVPIYDAVRYSQLNGIGTFSIFNTAILADVTLFPGNPPIEFGNTTSGAIAMTTDERILEASSNSLILSPANIGLSREQKINESQSLKLFTNWQPSKLIKGINPNALEDINNFNSIDAGLYWYGKKNNLKWKIFNYTNGERYNVNFDHPSYNGLFQQQKVRNSLISSLVWNYKDANWSLNTGLSNSWATYQYSNVNYAVDKNDLFGSINYQLQKKQFSIKSGLSNDYRYASGDGNFHSYDFALGTDHPTIEFEEDININNFEAYFYSKFYLNKSLTAGIGLRKNIPLDSINYLSRQLNLAYEIGNWKLIFGVGKYHKQGLSENTGETFLAESSHATLDLEFRTKSMKTNTSLFYKNTVFNNQPYEVIGWELYQELRPIKRIESSISLT